MFFKRLGSRTYHKEIKLQEGVFGIDYIFCKTSLNLIRRLVYTLYTLKHVLSPPMYLFGIHNFNKSVPRKRVVSFNVITSI